MVISLVSLDQAMLDKIIIICKYFSACYHGKMNGINGKFKRPVL